MVHMEFEHNLSSIIKDLKSSSYVSSIPFSITLSRHVAVIPHTVTNEKRKKRGGVKYFKLAVIEDTPVS